MKRRQVQNQKQQLKIALSYEAELEKAIGDCKTVLDVGCGSASPIRGFSGKFYCMGVDAFIPSIKTSMDQQIHDDYCQADALRIDERFKPGSFDCVLALDLIEHLTKSDALRLISKMETIASKKVIIFTPNGFFSQEEYDGNPLQLHRSGWTPDEMKKMGYKVIGINGWKPIRGENAAVKLWPKKPWKWIATRTQLFVRDRPEMAFQILCVKEMVG